VVARRDKPCKEERMRRREEDEEKKKKRKRKREIQSHILLTDTIDSQIFQ